MKKHKRQSQNQVVDDITVLRYKSSTGIRAMIAENQIIEAFVHTQLAIEVILWNKIVELFREHKSTEVLTTIENSNKGKDKANTSTYELIKWSHFLCALNDNDFGHLIEFNAKRNELIHGHGKWWSVETYKEALQQGIRFLEQNNF